MREEVAQKINLVESRVQVMVQCVADCKYSSAIEISSVVIVAVAVIWNAVINNGLRGNVEIYPCLFRFCLHDEFHIHGQFHATVLKRSIQLRITSAFRFTTRARSLTIMFIRSVSFNCANKRHRCAMRSVAAYAAAYFRHKIPFAQYNRFTTKSSPSNRTIGKIEIQFQPMYGFCSSLRFFCFSHSAQRTGKENIPFYSECIKKANQRCNFPTNRAAEEKKNIFFCEIR